MTPIRVRGKKDSVLQEQRRVSNNNSVGNPHSKHKRSRSSASTVTHPAKLPRPSIREDIGSFARDIAPLELLPTELLENIFFCCLNISLPQASPTIGRKLASAHVKTHLLLKVCSAESYNTYPCKSAAFFPTIKDQANAQSAILRLRWMTLPFLRQVIPGYITKTIVRELGARKLRWLGSGPLVNASCEHLIRQYVNDNSFRFDMERAHGLAYWETSWWLENPTRLFVLAFGVRDGLVVIEVRHLSGYVDNRAQFGRITIDSWNILSGTHGFRIPHKLLQGPWNEYKCEFLEIVLRGNATVDWIGSTSGEVAEQGLVQAIRDHNVRAIKSLVAKSGTICSESHWTESHWNSRTYSEDNVERLGSDPWPISRLREIISPTLRGVGVIPRTEHLRTAVIDEGCHEDVVDALLSAWEMNINPGDDDLLHWAIVKTSQGEAQGLWLLQRLRCITAG